MINKQLKELPSVSQVIHEINDSITIHNRYLKDIINSEIKLYRKLAQSNELNYTRREIIKRIIQEVERLNQSSIKNIINGTGIVLHTGFGRAPISKKIIQRVATKLDGYINLNGDCVEILLGCIDETAFNYNVKDFIERPFSFKDIFLTQIKKTK